MADSTLSTMDAVAALMQERQKFEGWLSALDARRANTPPRVYERVQADYQGRLDTVMSELAGRASELEAVSRGLHARVDTLRAEEEKRQEERAEAELRAAVGEYAPEQWEELRSVADAEIGHVSAQLAEQRAELERVEGILAVARPPRAAQRADGGGNVNAGATAGAGRGADAAAGKAATNDIGGASIGVVRVSGDAPDVGNGSSRAGGGGAAPTASTAPAAPDAARPQPVHQYADQPATDSDESSFDDLAFLKSIVEPTAPTAGPVSQAPTASTASTASSAAAPAAPRATPQRAEEARGSTPSRGLAALRSLLGSDDRSASASAAATPSPSAGRGGAADDARMNAAARDESATPALKTLRCAECGTLNYPTEWYCERCGGELAAM